jgi:hypothetical protein
MNLKDQKVDSYCISVYSDVPIRPFINSSRPPTYLFLLDEQARTISTIAKTG